jgi:phospholipid/cholesterol/gamma-HCH transport system permease protein
MESEAAAPERPAAVLEAGNLRCTGAWLLPLLLPLERQLTRTAWPSGAVVFDLTHVTALDTVGAWLLQRTALDLRQHGGEPVFAGLAARLRPLFDAVVELGDAPLTPPLPESTNRLEAIGRAAADQGRHYLGLLVFLGETVTVMVPLLLRPAHLRWRLLLHDVAEAGYRALPIVGLLAFLLGVVIAYQGGVQLRQYGADVFIADLVGLSMLRELSPLIAAIIVAGRTGSAYAAQIGTMKVTEEINALAAIGLRPIEVLVVPKMLALVVSLTLLTVFADITGLLGGMVIAQAILDISPTTFVDRVAYAVSLPSYLIGIGKAPIFAAIIAWIGCYQGFQVAGGAEMVGRHTTASVVQSVFLVIVVDAVFSVIFSELGI